MTRSNYSPLKKSPKLSRELQQVSTNISEQADCKPSPSKMDSEALNTSVSQERTLNSLSTIVSPNGKLNPKQCVHPLPVKNPALKAYQEQVKDKQPDEIIQEEFIPSVFAMREIRDSGANDVTRFNAAAWFAGRVIPDRIQVDKRSLEVKISSKDLVKLIESVRDSKGDDAK